MRYCLFALFPLVFPWSAQAQQPFQTVDPKKPVITSADVGSAPNSQALAVRLTAAGSGINGPRHAQTGVLIDARKDDWGRSRAVGEVDGISVITRNGGSHSDTSAYLANSQGTGQGFINDFEGTTSIYDTAAKTISHAIDVQLGVINSPTSAYLGLVLNCTAGACSTAILTQAKLGGPSWNRIFENIDPVSSKPNFVIDRDGSIISRTGSYTGVDGVFSGTISAGSVDFSMLPAKCHVGQQLYVIDGRKPGESVGQGSGVEVICSYIRKNGPPLWLPVITAAVAVAN